MSVTIDGTNGITTPEVDSTGPIAGTTGTFSGAVQASGVATNLYPLVSDTAKTATSTSVDFTGIPSWVKRITVMFAGVSLSGTDLILVRIGDSGGIENTGYISTGTGFTGSAGSTTNNTTGFVIPSDTASYLVSGVLVLTNISGNMWVASGVGKLSTGASWAAAGDKTLSDTLTQIRITVTGSNTFDAGTINILYE